MGVFHKKANTAVHFEERWIAGCCSDNFSSFVDSIYLFSSHATVLASRIKSLFPWVFDTSFRHPSLHRVLCREISPPSAVASAFHDRLMQGKHQNTGWTPACYLSLWNSASENWSIANVWLMCWLISPWFSPWKSLFLLTSIICSCSLGMQERWAPPACTHHATGSLHCVLSTWIRLSIGNIPCLCLLPKLRHTAQLYASSILGWNSRCDPPILCSVKEAFLPFSLPYFRDMQTCTCYFNHIC